MVLFELYKMNFKVKTYNAIAETGISLLKESDFSVSETEDSPDAMILRSYKLTDKDVESSIMLIRCVVYVVRFC